MTKKSALIPVILLMLIVLSSCVDVSHHVNLYDIEEILNEGDTYYSSAYEIKDHTLVLKHFSGTYTIQSFDQSGLLSIAINWEIDRGDMRVVWITSDNSILELSQGEHQLILLEGLSRLKIIADDVTCDIRWEFKDVDSAIELK